MFTPTTSSDGSVRSFAHIRGAAVLRCPGPLPLGLRYGVHWLCSVAWLLETVTVEMFVMRLGVVVAH